MKIIVNRKEFINVLTNMSNIVKDTPVRPVLSGTRLIANEFGIEFAGTTLETSLKNRIIQTINAAIAVYSEIK